MFFRRGSGGKEQVNNFVDFLKEADPKQKFRFGILMWFALYLGYFTFCLNWIIFSNLEGTTSEGWLKSFKDKGYFAGGDSELQLDAVNYAITFVRGVVTIGVAWFVTKLGHKKASVIALGLNCVALFLIFTNHAIFPLLVIGRMIMAAGGTMLIILVQPIIAKFFDLKFKGILSYLTPTAYILAALLANLLFVYQGKEQVVTKWFYKNWQSITYWCAMLAFLPWFAYMYFGKAFSTAENAEQEIEQNLLPENTYKGIIKEKNTWFWAFFYSFLLVASLIVSLKVPKIVEKTNKTLTQTLSGANISWSKLYICFFYFGCLAGMCLGRWAKTKYQRKPMIALCCGLGLFFWIMIFGCTQIKSHAALATAIVYISVFFFAFFAMGVQSIILYLPHEYKENQNKVKRLTIFYAYLWGIGYIIFTIYQIIVSSLIGSKQSTSSTGPYVAMGLTTLFVLLFFIFSLMIKESRPEYKFFPGLDKAGDIWRVLKIKKDNSRKIY